MKKKKRRWAMHHFRFNGFNQESAGSLIVKAKTKEGAHRKLARIVAEQNRLGNYITLDGPIRVLEPRKRGKKKKLVA